MAGAEEKPLIIIEVHVFPTKQKGKGKKNLAQQGDRSEVKNKAMQSEGLNKGNFGSSKGKCSYCGKL